MLCMPLRRTTLAVLFLGGLLFLGASIMVQKPWTKLRSTAKCDGGSIPAAVARIQEERDRPRHSRATHVYAAQAVPLAERVRQICKTFPEVFERRKSVQGTRMGSVRDIYLTTSHLLYATNPQNGRSVLYCSIPKVGNTSLKKFLLGLNESHRGRFTDGTLHLYVANNIGVRHLMYNEQVNKTTLDKTFKVMFVRHPFERLVSFFQDKSRRETTTGNYYYYKYWENAMAKSRGRVVTKQDVIRFDEFVDILLGSDPSKYDLHWQLFSDRCRPCTLPYNFVGTLRDLHKMNEWMGVKNNQQPWENRGPSDTRNATSYYFSLLPREKVMKLYKIYFPDFLMFGYGVDEYLSVSKPS